MVSGGEKQEFRLRPHHILCSRFLPLHLLARGEGFARVVDELQRLTEAESDAVIVVTEGPDQVCLYCPEYKNERCENPVGDEEKVRRWDARILEGLGVPYGGRMTVEEVTALVRGKAPLDFCRSRCPWREACGVFGENPPQ